MKENKNSKTVQEYRRDIFSLKSKIKEQQKYLEDLKQRHSDVDIFSDHSYTYTMKLKILQYNLSDIKQLIYKYSKEKATLYYSLNFAVYALGKACEIVGISREMVYRAVDIQGKCEVNWHDFSSFLKEVLRMQSTFINPIMNVLDPNDSTTIKKQRYTQLLQSFMINTQKQQNDLSAVNEGIVNLTKQIIAFKVDINKIFEEQTLNVATTTYYLKEKVKDADTLDCIALYCKCDPMKEGTIERKVILKVLEHKVHDIGNFKQGDTLKLKKR